MVPPAGVGQLVDHPPGAAFTRYVPLTPIDLSLWILTGFFDIHRAIHPDITQRENSFFAVSLALLLSRLIAIDLDPPRIAAQRIAAGSHA
jgi:hypothetical protein